MQSLCRRRTNRTIQLALLLTLPLWLASRHLHATEPTASDRETARALVAEGDRKTEAKDLPGALKAYQSAHKIMGVPTTGIEVARAELALGLLLEARDTALQVVRIPAKPGEPAVFRKARAEAEQLAESLAPRLAWVRIVIQGAQGPDLRVFIDDSQLAAAELDVERRVNPGKRVVRATAGGRKSASMELRLAEGEHKEVVLPLQGDDRPAPTPVASGPVTPIRPDAGPTEVSKQTSPWVWIGFGVGAAGAVAGTVTGIVSLSSASSAKGQCEGVQCPMEAKSDADRAMTFANISNVSFAVGLVGVGLGIYGLVAPQPTRKPAPAGSVRLTPTVGHASIGLIGEF